VTTQTKTRKPNGQPGAQPALPTFLDHIRELQGRLFAVVLTFIIVAGAAYPFFEKIAGIILAPLKKDQELVYLTPGGAFNFIIMVCAYVGIIGALPVIIFHLYRFVMPAVRKIHLRSALRYTVASLLLAIVGIVFAYYVSLPASLYFLTSFNLYHINPMLTIDSYFAFVMTYLLAGALLFQLPIIMLIINSVKPLTPKKLMHHQGHLLVGSFAIAAIISPTPDALNQTLLASPMVVMYQIGIIIIWLKNRKMAKQARRAAQARAIEEERAAQQKLLEVPHIVAPQTPVTALSEAPRVLPVSPAAIRSTDMVIPNVPAAPMHATTGWAKSVDGMRPAGIRRALPQSRGITVRTGTVRSASGFAVERRSAISPFSEASGRSVDGISVPRRA
jgi:sec-independent protein translocase protein TatC